MLNKNPYKKREWYDDIVDDTLPKDHPLYIIEEGTPFMAAYANNIENGVYAAHELIMKQASLIRKMQVQMEIDGRVPGNSGSFFDSFSEDPTRMNRLESRAVLTASRSAGTSTLNVDNAEGFKPLQEVTIYDETNSEDTIIKEVSEHTIVVQTILNDYKKGAVIALSNTEINANVLTIGAWGTYKITTGGELT